MKREQYVAHAARYISDHYLDHIPNARLEAVAYKDARELLLRVATYVWADKLDSQTATLRYTVPDTWWEHLKLELTARWPWLDILITPRVTTHAVTYEFTVHKLLPKLQLDAEPGPIHYTVEQISGPS